MIGPFIREYRFLSNYYPVAPGTVHTSQGCPARTVEHAFQAEKTPIPSEHRYILGLNTPGEAKVAGRRVILRTDWDMVKVAIMADLIQQKFAHNLDLAEKLLATGDDELIEVNTWGDRYWGAVWSDVVEDGVVGQVLDGENHLGKTLMVVRAELQARVAVVAMAEQGSGHD